MLLSSVTVLPTSAGFSRGRSPHQTMLGLRFRRPHMILKSAIAKKTCTVAVCAALLAWGGVSLAAEPQPDHYRPNDFLGLDLPTAVLSPKPLGPPAQFAPVRIEDASGDVGQQARAEP